MRCNTECYREPGGRWYNFYGRDQCRSDPDEGPHVISEFTEQPLESRPLPAMAVVHLTYRDENGEVRVMEAPPVLEGQKLEVTFPEPLPVTGWRIETTLPRLV